MQDIPWITEVLGRSIIYEEQKGSFAEARRIAEGHLAASRQAGDVTTQVDAFLSLGVVHMLQGEPPAAFQCFAEIDRLAPGDPARCYRAALYRNLATCLQYNFFPGGSGAGAAEINLRWDRFTDISQQEDRQTRLLASLSDPMILLEGALITRLLFNLPVSRSLLESLPILPPDKSEELFVQALRPAAQFRQYLETTRDPGGLLAYTNWAVADIFHRARQAGGDGQFLTQSNDLYSKAGDPAGLGLCTMTLGDWLSAPFSHPLVWNLAIQSSPSEGSQLSWALEAQEFSQTGADIGTALRAYDEAEQLFRSARSSRGLAAISLRRAYLAMLAADYQGAAGHAKRAEDAYDTCGDILGYRVAQVQRILSRVGAGELPEERDTAAAIGAWGAAQGSFSYSLGLGLLLGRAGRHWLIRVGDYERSLACYRLAEVLYSSLGAVINRAQSLVDQGDVYKAAGDLTAAQLLYEQALDLYEADLSARPQVARQAGNQILNLSTSVYLLYLQFMQADGMERSAQRIQSLLNRLGSGKTGSAGIVDLVKSGLQGIFSKDPGGAQTSGSEDFSNNLSSWALSNAAHSMVEQASVFVPLYRAVQARDQGDELSASNWFAKARQAILQVSVPDRYLVETSFLALQKKYAQAAEVYKKYLAEQEKNTGLTGSLVKVLSTVESERGKEEAHRKVENDLEQAFTALTRCKAYEDAHRYLELLIQSAGPDWWQRGPRPWLSLSDCGELYEGLEQLEKSLEFYGQAISELEKRRGRLSQDELKTALAADKGAQYLYFQAARTAYKIVCAKQQEGNIPEEQSFKSRMFNFTERGKARALLDLMAASSSRGSAARSESSAFPSSMHTWRQLSSQLTLRRGLLAQARNSKSGTPDQGRIVQLLQQIEADETGLRRTENELAEENPEFYRMINPQTPVLALDQLSKTIPPDTALLQYYFLGEDMLAWAITEQGMPEIHQAVINGKAVDRKIREFHRACAGRQPFQEAGKELAEIFLSPLANTINACQHLLIVPYGSAHELPFHVLPWNDQPLSATHSVRYLPSASALQFLVDHPAAGFDSMLAFGNPANMRSQSPDGSSMQAPPLPWSSTEAVYVAKIFEKGTAQTGEKATEEAFRMLLKDYRILHLATHGYLSVDAPLASSILFAEGEQLTVYELMGMQLDGQLVVLSACETAQGEITGGDDVLGMARGLLGAGARYAVVSLWPVNDLSTSLLMGEFYRQILSGVDPDVALQTAQNYLRCLQPEAIQTEAARLVSILQSANARHENIQQIQDAQNAQQARSLRPEGMEQTENYYSHPYYWAPFVVIG